MITLLVRVVILFLVMNNLLVSSVADRAYPGQEYDDGCTEIHPKESRHTRSYNRMSASIPSSKAPKQGLGISAWGIIFVILSIIFVGVAVYYISICYPIFCKKERKYDMIEI